MSSGARHEGESFEDYRARLKAEKRAVGNRQRYGRNYLHVSHKRVKHPLPGAEDLIVPVTYRKQEKPS